MQVPTEQCSLAAIMWRANFKRGVVVRRGSLPAVQRSRSDPLSLSNFFLLTRPYKTQFQLAYRLSGSVP